MAIFDNIRNVFRSNKTENKKEVKEAPVVYYNSLGVDYQQKTRYDQLATEGYSENAIVKKCIDLISSNASRVTLELYRGDQQVEEHPVLDLLSEPSSRASRIFSKSIFVPFNFRQQLHIRKRCGKYTTYRTLHIKT